MNIKPILVALALTVPVAHAEVTVYGVYSPKAETMDFDDMNHYRTSCNQRDEQLAFLKMQLDNQPFWERRSRAIINYYIRFIKTSCPEMPKKPQGCLNVREDFGDHSSHATVCRADHFKGPVINRWENDIDN